MSDDIKRMDLWDFKDLGYLQEVNRRFLHPLGLALEVMIDDDICELGGIWDYRDDPEGMRFGEVDATKAKYVSDQWGKRTAERETALGYMVQPYE